MSTSVRADTYATSRSGELSAGLSAIAACADLIVIARAVRVEDLEKIDYAPEDFKFKSAVYDCKAMSDDRMPEKFAPADASRGRPVQPKTVRAWMCCAERESIAVVEDGANVTENRTTVSDCTTVPSPSSYLSGKFPKVYSVILNGKKITEERYMQFKAEQMKRQGRYKFRRMRVTVEREEVLKGDPAIKEIVFEARAGMREREDAARGAFSDRHKGEHLIFLTRDPAGSFHIAECEGVSCPGDLPVRDGMVGWGRAGSVPIESVKALVRQPAVAPSGQSPERMADEEYSVH